MDISNNSLVCGSKDCRISFYLIEIKQSNILAPEIEIS